MGPQAQAHAIDLVTEAVPKPPRHSVTASHWKADPQLSAELTTLLDRLYGPLAARRALPRLLRLAQDTRLLHHATEISERDVLAITTTDQIHSDGTPLRALHRVLEEHLGGMVSGVHIEQLELRNRLQRNVPQPEWGDIGAISIDHRLMTNFTVGSISEEHPWFRGFLAGDERYADYFPSNATTDTGKPSKTFDAIWGPVDVQTSFDDKRVDLDFTHPNVLLDVAETLLAQLTGGPQFLRLCDLPENADDVIGVLRALVSIVDPHARLVTEQDDLSTMLIDALRQADVSALSTWATAAGEQSVERFVVSADFDDVVRPSSTLDETIERYVATQAISLAVAGIPMISLSGLLGVMRHELPVDLSDLEADLRIPWTRSAKICGRLRRMLQVRRAEAAFHPRATQHVCDFGSSIFAVERIALDQRSRVLALHNLTDATVSVGHPGDHWFDLFTAQPTDEEIVLGPYGFTWLRQSV